MRPTQELRDLLDTVDAIWHYLDKHGYLLDAVDLGRGAFYISMAPGAGLTYPAVAASNHLHNTHFATDCTIEPESDYTLKIGPA